MLSSIAIVAPALRSALALIDEQHATLAPSPIRRVLTTLTDYHTPAAEAHTTEHRRIALRRRATS